MVKNTSKFLLITLALMVSSLACRAATGESTAGGDATATPNLTLTAVFSVPENTPTPLPPTDTPAPTATTAPPTNTPGPTATPTISPTPTKGFTPPPDNPIFTPDPDGGPASRKGASVEAQYVSAPPTIDGNGDDWAGINYFTDEVVWGGGYYSGPADLYGEFKIGWDATYLYFWVKVFDNRFAQDATGGDIYLGDHIEILLDTLVSRDYYISRMNFDDYQLLISPGDLSEDVNIPEAYLWYPVSKEGPLAVAQIAAETTFLGYRVEGAIPWTVFDITPAIGQHFGFAFSVSDNDSPGTYQQQTILSNVLGRFFSNPTTWGDMVLTVREVIEEVDETPEAEEDETP